MRVLVSIMPKSVLNDLVILAIKPEVSKMTTTVNIDDEPGPDAVRHPHYRKSGTDLGSVKGIGGAGSRETTCLIRGSQAGIRYIISR